MLTVAQRLTRAVKRYDRDLYVYQPQIGGMRFLMRKAVKLVAYDFGGSRLLVAERDDKQLLALTDTWTAKGQPVDWGELPLLAKIREMDAHNDTHDGGIIARLERQMREVEERKRRQTRTLHENMAYEAHGAFRKAFKDVNTANFSRK